jgi:hypothetical protein
LPVTEIILLPDRGEELRALMAFRPDAPPDEFVAELTAALRASMLNTDLYKSALFGAPGPNPFDLIELRFHPHVVASALHYACARAMRPMPDDVMVYVDAWYYVKDCTPAPYVAPPEPVADEPAPAVTPGVTPPILEPANATRRLPAPVVSVASERRPGRPPLSLFERPRAPRRRYLPAPFWWAELITQLDDVFALPPTKLIEGRGGKGVEAYGLLNEVLLRALESAPPHLTVGELARRGRRSRA